MIGCTNRINADKMKISVSDNIDKKRFETKVDGVTAYVEYILNSKGMIFFTHTEVPRKIGGRGVASKLVGQALEMIDNRNLKLVPLCPYVAAYLRRHPEWKRLLAENFNV